MAEYESEHTRFMREWMQQHPEARQGQKEGRALWWDKPQDLQTQAQYRAARVRQKGYYYQPDL
jgi:hypothetical protein